MPKIQAKQIEGYASPIELVEIIPLPEGPRTTQGTQSLNPDNNYIGASYFLRRAANMSRLIYRLTANTTIGSKQRFLIYQTPDGGGGTATKVASGTFTTTALGAQSNTLVFTEGVVSFAPGLIYILCGRADATLGATLRVFANNSLDLLNSNVDANTHPISFTTAIAANAADPATFNPLTAAIAATTDVATIVRLRA
jgi:hypothetical protein